MRVFGLTWWLCVALLLFACADATAPTMQYVLDGDVSPTANIYANAGPASGGMCDPGGDDDSPTNVPKVHICFRQFFTALGVSGVTIGLCAAEASGAGRVAVAIAKWSACGLGVIKGLESWGNWLDATQVDGWADWSEREISNRMREAAFARMAAREQQKEDNEGLP